jgi:(1->4)-alpha-D-glucan 1-alpha-D-glucosylmutase
VEQFVRSIAAQGRWNSIARLVVHLTAPGVPDIYQGDELFFRALVDPDNRRPVDWEKRARALDAIAESLDTDFIDPERLAGWCAQPEDDGLKLYVTARLLHLRQRHRDVVAHGGYQPLAAEGGKAVHVLAFQRAHHEHTLIVVVPRLTCGLGAHLPIRGAWGDTVIRLPSHGTAASWRCELGGQVVQSQNGALAMADVTAVLPVAVLSPQR